MELFYRIFEYRCIYNFFYMLYFFYIIFFIITIIFTVGVFFVISIFPYMLSLFFLFILHMQVFIFHNFEYTPQLKSRHILRRARTFFRYTHDRRYSTRRCLSLIYTVFCFRFLFVSTAKPMH